MGEIISVGDSLLISLFGMLIVFAGLLLIAFLIRLLGRTKTQEAIPEELDRNLVGDEELVAVITGALLAYMDTDPAQIRIRDIRLVEDPASDWSRQALEEQLASRL